MKIINVTPGLIPIPPNGWGAVEKIIWEKHNNLQKIGHQSEIKYLNEIDKDSDDIIHIHVANLAIEAHKRGIPYYFTMHDHHSVLYGKQSELYKNNYEAIKHSVLSFLPAPYLIEYFGLDNAVYIPHGVNTEIFTPTDDIGELSILCVANNGYANDVTYDRKGFIPAIESAKELGLPITICGPKKNNEAFFEAHKQYFNYDKLTIKYNLSEEDLIQEYKRHSIFLHLSELEAGHPNLTILEAMASGLVVVGTLDGDVDIDGFVRVNYKENTEKNIIKGLNYAIKNLNELRMQSLNSIKQYDWHNITKKYVLNYKYSKESVRQKFINSYDEAKITYKSIKEKDNNIHFDFIDGPKLEVIGDRNTSYEAKFVDTDTDELVFSTTIKTNHWAKASIKYFKNWTLKLYENGVKRFEHQFNPVGRRVYIAIESSAIGDTLAWIPYVEEFRRQWNCEVICSTFHNDLLESAYKDIQFVTPGTEVDRLYAKYALGWYYYKNGAIDHFKNPINFKQQPLQKTATDILGLEYKEIQPNVVIPNRTKVYDKLAIISMQATAQAKYWNNDTGWDELVSYLKDNGYTVACIDKHKKFGVDGSFNTIPTGALDWTGSVSLQTRAAQLKNADLFIGIGSGISWLSWAVGTPVVLISGFSYPYTEMQDCIRITTPDGKCTGCFNRHRLDPSDWNWCPEHKGTDRQFECSKSITADMVIEKIKKHIMNIPENNGDIILKEENWNGNRLDIQTAWSGLENYMKSIINSFNIKCQTALEFGVEYGYSTYILSQLFNKVIGVDTFEGDVHAGFKNLYDEVKDRFSDLNIDIIKSDFRDYIKNNNKYFDLIHIDIVHTYEDTYEAAEWAVRHSKVVILHDTISYIDINKVCEDLSDKFGLCYYNIDKYHGLGILYNPKLENN